MNHFENLWHLPLNCRQEHPHFIWCSFALQQNWPSCRHDVLHSTEAGFIETALPSVNIIFRHKRIDYTIATNLSLAGFPYPL